MRPGVEIPEQPKIAFVGEAWGETEDRLKLPFQGASGQELNQMAHESGILRSECLTTNVICARPPGNNFDSFCCSRKEVGDAKFRGELLAPLRAGKYLKPEFYPELEALASELSNPWLNLAIPLGNTALWALTLATPAISKARGAVIESTLISGLKLLPTYHPAAILREWSLRLIAVMDFIKARKESTFKDIRRPKREIWIEPTDISDLWDFHKRFIIDSKLVSVDIENPYKFRGKRLISCVGMAPDPKHALVIPFMTARGSYWDTPELELEAWDFIRQVVESKPVICQNGFHDVYCLADIGVLVKGWEADTMFEHHALYPELPKDLGFLGATYTNETSWKLNRPRGYSTEKDDE